MRDLVTGILEEFADRAAYQTQRIYDMQCAIQALKAESQREYNKDYRGSERGRFMRGGQRARARVRGPVLPGVVDAPMSVEQWIARRVEIEAMTKCMVRIHRRAVNEGEQLALLEGR